MLMILRASDRRVRTLINVLTYMGGGRWLLCTAHWLTEHFITWRLHRCLTVHWVNGRCKLNWLNGHYRIVAKWALHNILIPVCCMVYWALCSPDRMNAAWDAGAWLGMYLVAVALAVLMMSVLYISICLVYRDCGN